MATTAGDEAEFRYWLDHDAGRVERWTRRASTWCWDHLFRLRAHGAEHLPATGAYLLVPNHSSYADPFLLSRHQRRWLRFMAKSTMFRHPLIRDYMRGGGAFPVRRGKGDTFAMELARRLLDDGQPVVVFPEGTRFRDSIELGPPKRGAARLALEAKVPVVPAATWGAKRRELYGQHAWNLPKITVVYGEPMDFTHLEPTAENIDKVRDAVWARVHELYEQARRLTEDR